MLFVIQTVVAFKVDVELSGLERQAAPAEEVLSRDPPAVENAVAVLGVERHAVGQISVQEQAGAVELEAVTGQISRIKGLKVLLEGVVIKLHFAADLPAAQSFFEL